MRAALRVLSLALVVASCSESPDGPGPTTPVLVELPTNVLVVVLDDMGLDTVGAYGAQNATPNLDALAASGVRFEAAWSSPFCEPTRAAIQTGRYGFRTGIGAVGPGGLPLTEVTIAELLEEATDGAIATAAIGKWHLAGENNGTRDSPNLAGYDHFAGTLGNIDDYYRYKKIVDGELEETRGYATSNQVQDALDWIRSASEPWFCYLAFNAVHHPLHPPPPRLHDESFPEDPVAAGHAMFRAMVQAVDAEFGRLVRGLGDERRARTTIIALSDNGTNRNHLPGGGDANAGKGTVTESGIRVPFVVAGPPVVQPGRSVEHPIDVTDVFATVADLLGVEIDRGSLPGTLDSVSLLPYLTTPNAAWQREFAFAESFRPNGPGPYQVVRRAIRDDRYKLVTLRRANGEETEELYDLERDRRAEEDLLARGDDSVRAKRDALAARLAELLEN